MKKQLIATAITAITAAAIGFTAVAQADAELYGSIRAGVVSSDDDGANSGNRLDLGATENDGSVGGQGLYSRIGFKGSTDLGNGASAGFKVERQVGKDALTTRHTNVYVGGSWGKLTLGQQDNPYRNARHWDQTWFLGGQYSTDGGSRIEGINYALSSGAFSLNVMAVANDTFVDATEDLTGVSRPVALPVEAPTDFAADDFVGAEGAKVTMSFEGSVALTADQATALNARNTLVNAVNVAANTANAAQLALEQGDFDIADLNARTAGSSEVTGDDGIDGWVIQLGYDFGPVALNFAHQTNNQDYKLMGVSQTEVRVAPADATVATAADTIAAAKFDRTQTAIDSANNAAADANATRDTTAFGLNGSAGPLDWYAAYQTSELNGSGDFEDNDTTSFGGFLGWNLSEKNTLYAYHVVHSADRATYGDTDGDTDGVQLGVTRGEDYTETILGYSRKMGPDMTFIAEYLTLDHDTDADGSEPSVLALALKYDF